MTHFQSKHDTLFHDLPTALPPSLPVKKEYPTENALLKKENEILAGPLTGF
jgi:hypothetical protein